MPLPDPIAPMPKHSSFPQALPPASKLEVGLGDPAFEQARQAARDEDVDALKSMLAANPRLGLLRQNGQSLLIFVAGNGCVPLAEALLLFSDLESSAGGDTALARAAFRGHAEMTAFLVKNGAQIHWPDNHGLDALMLAATSEWHPDCVDCARVVAPLADASRRDDEGRNAFLSAVALGRHEIALIIFESQPPAILENMATVWLDALLGEFLGRNGRFHAEGPNDEAAVWPLLDGLGCLLPNGFDAISQATQAQPRDLPRSFAASEAQALRSEIASTQSTSLSQLLSESPESTNEKFAGARAPAVRNPSAQSPSAPARKARSL